VNIHADFILLSVVIGLILALGSLDKDEKIFSTTPIVLFSIIFIVGILGGTFGNPERGSSLSLQDVNRIVIGSAVGVTVVVSDLKKIWEKRFPLMAGLSTFLIALGSTLFVIRIILH
jgi:hypothetical protein